MIQKRFTKAGDTRYDSRPRAPDGKERSATFRTRKAAERWERDNRTAMDRGGWIDPRRAAATFGELADWWSNADPSKRPATLTRDEEILRLHILPTLGARQLGSITPKDVQALINRWAEKAAASTIRRQYAVLHAILEAAVTNDHLMRSPCRGIKLPAVRQAQRRLPSPTEVVALIDAVGPAHGPMVLLAAMTGMRWGELAGLRVGRLDLLRCTVHVTEQITAHGHTGPPKSSAGVRTLALPRALTAELAALLAARGLTAADADALVFVSERGKALDYANWSRRVWRPACKAVGLDGIGFHDLRRLNATTLVGAGVDVKTAQARLGHSDVRLTLEVYAQATSEADRGAAEAVAERLLG